MIRLRALLLSLLIIYCTGIFAQKLPGVVKDGISQAPITNAIVITSKSTMTTNKHGEFTLTNMKVGDRIAIRHMGYETVEVVIKKITDTLFVYLKQDAIVLREVMINTRNHKRDSLNIRKEYANAFAYKGPSFTDMFIARDPSYNSPFPFSNPRSTASLISLNVLQVLNVFGKKKAQKTKLKEILVRDEELNYIDNTFSKEKVRSVVDLEGDALIKFMDTYRPSMLTLKKMTSYELTLYIKKSYEEFKKINPLK